jgi:hypothetical protein
MATTFVAFDTRSGQILSVYHGAVDARHARESAQYHSKISDEHIAVISVPSQSVELGKQYKVDVGRKVLVEAATGESGVGFGFGVTGRSSSPKRPLSS